jgi:hypothetical protein
MSSKELKNPIQSESGCHNQKPKSSATTLYSDDEEPEAFGCDEESDSEINEHQQDDKFEVDEDIDISAAVLRSIIDSGIGKIAAQDSQASVSSSLMVEGDESFDWNTV